MILKFNDFIEEGFLSKTINRSKSGEERKEDMISSNIDQLKPIEIHNKLDIKFADDILIYNNKDVFTEKEMLELQDGFIKKYNDRPGFDFWYVPHENDIKKMLKLKSIKFSNDEDGNLVITNNRTKTVLKTNGKIFWCNSMMGPQVWYYYNDGMEICDPTWLLKQEANILLYRT